MYILYPEIKPYARHRLKVSEQHELYVDESGNPDGIPVLFVHGGPGGACAPRSRCFFDPDKYRIILFDQRGCGRSTPVAYLGDNTTDHLIEDIEAVRKFLDVERWLLFGGSWGASLSLLYAQAYPTRVLGMVLRGVFLGRQKDLDWLFKSGANEIFPDYWEDFVAPIPQEERGDLIAAYHKRLTGTNEIQRLHVAKAWSLWEARCSTLRPSADAVERFTESIRALALARIETHFFQKNCFIDENQILNNIKKIKDIPGVIVHGRYDIVCPLENALQLHKAWPRSELHIIRDAGHSVMEPNIVDALIRATRDFARSLSDLA